MLACGYCRRQSRILSRKEVLLTAVGNMCPYLFFSWYVLSVVCRCSYDYAAAWWFQTFQQSIPVDHFRSNTNQDDLADLVYREWYVG